MTKKSDKEAGMVDVEYVKIKLIFLDVDGVLNYEGFIPLEKTAFALSDLHIKRLANIIEKTKNCKIVLTTNWRYKTIAIKALYDKMSKIGNLNIDKVVIGHTKLDNLRYFNCNPSKKINNNDLSNQRAFEIKEYLDTINNNNNNNKNIKYIVVSWIAIDDTDISLFSNQTMQFMKGHLLLTDSKVGITDDNVQTAIQMLNSFSHLTN